jgi:hypothetical protein
MTKFSNSLPPLPERPIGTGMAETLNKNLTQYKEQIEASDSLLIRRIIEHLGQADPEIQKMIEDARRVKRTSLEAFTKQHALDRTLRRSDLPAIKPPETLPPRELLKHILPRLRMVRLPHNIKNLATENLEGSIEDIIRACTEICWRLDNFPIWGDAFSSKPELGMWLQWTYKPTTAACYAHQIGIGKSQDHYTTNEARWHWWFGPDADESLDVWLTGRLSGPCDWRGGGDVTLWLLTEAWVDKYTPSTPDQPGHWTEIGHLPRSIRLSYSTNDGLDQDGPPPRGNFESDGNPYVSFTPSNRHFRIDAEAGRMHLVTLDVQLALIANFNAAIAIGEIGGDYIDLCELITYCNVCRCT